MENDEHTDQSNITVNRTSIEDHDKVPEESDNPWKDDIFDETDPNVQKAPKDPKRTLFY